mgnify:CR=1 FL=1
MSTDLDLIGNDNEVDLFEQYDQQPPELKAICDKYADGDYTYETCEKFLAEVEVIGYTFDYDLSAEPFGLKKVEWERYDLGVMEVHAANHKGVLVMGDDIERGRKVLTFVSKDEAQGQSFAKFLRKHYGAVIIKTTSNKDWAFTVKFPKSVYDDLDEYVQYLNYEQALFVRDLLKAFGNNGASKGDLMDLTGYRKNCDSALDIRVVRPVQEVLPQFDTDFHVTSYKDGDSGWVNIAEALVKKMNRLFRR